MLSTRGCRKQPALQDATDGRPQSSHQHPGSPMLLLLILLTSWTGTCKGAPLSSITLGAEQELQLWNEIHDLCSEFLSDSQFVPSNALEEICLDVMGIRPKIQGSEEKDYKRFLFHYSKSHDSGNSDIMEEVQGPGGVLSRGYFLFRPRNGRRSAGFR
ncbi:neuromedin-U isoform 3-T3 [Discoglossus pictus]